MTAATEAEPADLNQLADDDFRMLVRRFIEANGNDPVTPFSERLAPLWGDGTREVRWPLTILAGRVE